MKQTGQKANLYTPWLWGKESGCSCWDEEPLSTFHKAADHDGWLRTTNEARFHSSCLFFVEGKGNDLGKLWLVSHGSTNGVGDHQ